MTNLIIRPAHEGDVPLILRFIRELAVYQKLEHEVVADEASLRATLFGPHPFAEVLIAEQAGESAGFALFFHSYSTFQGRPGIHLEDLYVSDSLRGQGIGGALLAYLADLAVARGCGRLEWSVLDWNTPAIGFYRGLGAAPMDDWTLFRLTGEALKRVAVPPDDG